jgi:tetratricopeptide (TPR) repeat protein
MGKLVFVFLLVDAAALISAEMSSVQEGGHDTCQFWGQVVSYGGLNADGMEVELSGNSLTPRQRTHIVDGAFDLRPVPAGIYQFRLYDRSGQMILRYTHSLTGLKDYVILRLPYALKEASSANVVSLSELNRKVPQRALDAFRAGIKAIDAGEVQKSVESFQKAVAIYSQYAEAEINLAVLEGGFGRREEALQHAQRAFEIDPEWVETGHTLAVLLIASKRYAQAEALSRAMLANQLAAAEMHAILAVSLIGQRGDVEEAFGHLRLASAEFPMARLLAANALVETGRPALAAVQVNSYLQSSVHECERAALEHWIASLHLAGFNAVADAR